MSECNDCVCAQVMIGRDVESNSSLNPVSGRSGRCHFCQLLDVWAVIKPSQRFVYKLVWVAVQNIITHPHRNS